MSLTQDIKDFALDLGYSRVGITPADGFPDYIEDLKSRYDMYTWYIEGPRQPILGAIPRNIMTSAKSIVSLVYDYSQRAFPENLLGKIGRLYQARCYNTPEHRINGVRPQLMREFLKKKGCRTGQSISVPERLTAARAGIVTYGKNTFAFAKGIGSFILLNSFVVDVELEYDNATIEMKCPSKCTACIEACPTQAIYESLKMNPQRCIAFNTFWTQDGVPGNKSYIPPELRKKMGTWIHGCDICQQVCPRNKNKLKTKLPPDEFLEKIAEDFSLAKLLNLSEEFYVKNVQPLMYNYIKDKKYFRRNAAIALGNLGNPGFIPDLAHAIQDSEELVRGYAAWALGQTGGKKAKVILETGLARETSDSVKMEIKAALAIV